MSQPELEVVPGSDAKKTPIRVAFVQGEERPAVDASDEPLVMTFPHLLVRELIAFLALSIGLLALSLSVDAPLEQIADPLHTPNPAKAPWYFLGQQELLHYYPPIVSGVLLPGLLVIALAVIPYVRLNLERPSLSGREIVIAWSTIAILTLVFYFTGSQPVWPLIGSLWLVGGAMTVSRSRSLPFWIFVWFLVAAVALTVIGIFFSWPGWSFTLPWRDGVYL
jgi:hypothetical protein